MSFPDHFSHAPHDYLRNRPRYPDRLYDLLVGFAPSDGRVLDCATGNGQAAIGLARVFREVVAIDASEKQLEHALPHPRITYRQGLAEQTGLDDQSFDAITVAAGAHWLDLDRFYPEVRRLLKPGGVLALWTYDASPRVTAEVEAVLARFRQTEGLEWPPGFEDVRQGYRTLPFPFEALQVPALTTTADWDLAGLVGHLRSWSAVQRFATKRGVDPVAAIADDLAEAWGDPSSVRTIEWPLHVRIGRRT